MWIRLSSLLFGMTNFCRMSRLSATLILFTIGVMNVVQIKSCAAITAVTSFASVMIVTVMIVTHLRLISLTTAHFRHCRWRLSLEEAALIRCGLFSCVPRLFSAWNYPFSSRSGFQLSLGAIILPLLVSFTLASPTSRAVSSKWTRRSDGVLDRLTECIAFTVDFLKCSLGSLTCFVKSATWL